MMARSLILPLVLLNLAACVLSKHGADRGIAYLGSFTFYRVVDGTRDVLVRFDQKHHWHTGFDEAFEELAAQVAYSHHVNSSQVDCHDFIVGNLPISKMQHEVDNIVIAKRYSISTEDLPALRLFKKGMDPKAMPLEVPPHVSTKSPAQMMKWIEEETGIFCGLVGQLKDLHILAQRLMKGADANQILEEAKEAVRKMEPSDQVTAKNYMEAFEKAVHDKDWPFDEYQRVKARMPRWSPHVPPDDLRDTDHQRLHALSSFIDPVEDEASEIKSEL